MTGTLRNSNNCKNLRLNWPTPSNWAGSRALAMPGLVGPVKLTRMYLGAWKTEVEAQYLKVMWIFNSQTRGTS
jgi:hypothetical protein